MEGAEEAVGESEEGESDILEKRFGKKDRRGFRGSRVSRLSKSNCPSRPLAATDQQPFRLTACDARWLALSVFDFELSRRSGSGSDSGSGTVSDCAQWQESHCSKLSLDSFSFTQPPFLRILLALPSSLPCRCRSLSSKRLAPLLRLTNHVRPLPLSRLVHLSLFIHPIPALLCIAHLSYHLTPFSFAPTPSSSHPHVGLTSSSSSLSSLPLLFLSFTFFFSQPQSVSYLACLDFKCSEGSYEFKSIALVRYGYEGSEAEGGTGEGAS